MEFKRNIDPKAAMGIGRVGNAINLTRVYDISVSPNQLAYQENHLCIDRLLIRSEKELEKVIFEVYHRTNEMAEGEYAVSSFSITQLLKTGMDYIWEDHIFLNEKTGFAIKKILEVNL